MSRLGRGRASHGRTRSASGALVPGVRGEDDVHFRRRLVEQVATDEGDVDAVGPGVEPDRRLRERIDVGGGHLRGPRACGRDRHEPAPRREVQDRAVRGPRPGAPARIAPSASPPAHANAQNGIGSPSVPRASSVACQTRSTSSARWRRIPGRPPPAASRVCRGTNDRRWDSGRRASHPGRRALAQDAGRRHRPGSMPRPPGHVSLSVFATPAEIAHPHGDERSRCRPRRPGPCPRPCRGQRPIPCWNTARSIGPRWTPCIVAPGGMPIECVVVDDASSDCTSDVVPRDRRARPPRGDRRARPPTFVCCPRPATAASVLSAASG